MTGEELLDDLLGEQRAKVGEELRALTLPVVQQWKLDAEAAQAKAARQTVHAASELAEAQRLQSTLRERADAGKEDLARKAAAVHAERLAAAEDRAAAAADRALVEQALGERDSLLTLVDQLRSRVAELELNGSWCRTGYVSSGHGYRILTCHS